MGADFSYYLDRPWNINLWRWDWFLDTVVDATLAQGEADE